MSIGRALSVVAMCASCGGARASPSSAPTAVLLEKLPGTDDALHEIVPRGSDKYTVVVFFSADCHILKLHDERLRRLANHYGERGVRFYGVDPERGATIDRDRAEGERRGYPFPILLDGGARLAKMFGAEYAGHVVVLDGRGAVVYRGGIDSDRIRLTQGATWYLNDALADLLAGKSARIADAKTLGCALRTW
jgi:hypothetical protein